MVAAAHVVVVVAAHAVAVAVAAEDLAVADRNRQIWKKCCAAVKTKCGAGCPRFADRAASSLLFL